MKPEICIIAAVARNRALGLKNKLLYWLPNDLKRFKQLTTGHTIVMGRRTYESLPKGALPNRRNVVLSRSVNCIADERFPGCDCYRSLADALKSCATDEQVFVIGGASIYKQALPLADRLCLTEIDDVPAEADVFFPPYEEEWQLTWSEHHEADERHTHAYTFADYQRKA